MMTTTMTTRTMTSLFVVVIVVVVVVVVLVVVVVGCHRYTFRRTKFNAKAPIGPAVSGASLHWAVPKSTKTT